MFPRELCLLCGAPVASICFSICLRRASRRLLTNVLPCSTQKNPTARSSAETYVCSLNAHCFEWNRRLGHFLKNNGLKSTDSDYSGHIVSNTWFHQLCLYLQFSDGPTTVQARVVHRSVHYTTYFGHCLYLAIDRGRWGVCGSLQSANREPHSADYTPVW